MWNAKEGKYKKDKKTQFEVYNGGFGDTSSFIVKPSSNTLNLPTNPEGSFCCLASEYSLLEQDNRGKRESWEERGEFYRNE